MDRSGMLVRYLSRLSVVAVLSLQSQRAFSDESSPTGPVIPAAAVGEKSETRVPPAIPWRVLNEAISGFGRDVVVLTDEQKRAIGDIRNGSYKIPIHCNRVKLVASDSQSSLFDNALRLIEQDEEDKIAYRILAVLSDEQIAEIRSKRRGSIVQAESQRLTRTVPKPPTYHQTMHSVGSYLLRNDVLSLLDGTDALDMLQLSDQQFASVQEIREQAWPQAMSTASECVEMLRLAEEQKPPASPAVPADAATVHPILEKTMAVLTPEQQTAYRKRVEERVRELQKAPLQDPLEMMVALRQHAMPEEIRTVTRNGQTSLSVRLFNYFAVPGNAQALEISGEQQAQIANLLREAEEASVKSMMDAQAKTQNTDAETNARISEVVNAFHKRNADAVFAVLSEEQIRILQEKKLRQLGLEALRLPEVRSELNLSEMQASELEAILNRRMPLQDSTIVISAAEARKDLRSIPKNQEEAIRQFEEHRKQFDAQTAKSQKQYLAFARQRHQDIWNLLTDLQQATLTRLTGVQAPAESNPRI